MKDLKTRNFLFKGDNLKALKALQATHSNSIKCVYVDPPYNTGISRKHFRDNRGSKEWLLMMRKRLKILKSLLRDDGSIWISIDDSELHNLRKLCDQIFGKEQFLATITWQHKINWDGYKGKFQLDHTYILSYSKTKSFEFENKARPRTVWLEAEVGGQKEAIEESKQLFGDNNIFSTPKPEGLLRYIIGLTTKKNEVVLDCFSGSGTTGAVAEKMGRRWIMMEIGAQCETHILPRMSKLAVKLDPNEARLWKKSSKSFIYVSQANKYKSFSVLGN